METLLSTSNLSKHYHGHAALDNVSVDIHRGDIYGLVGKNGAGKTTFLKLISGLAKPTSGDIKLLDNDEFSMSRIGALIEAPGFYPNMTAYENLKLKCLCAGISGKGYIEDKLRLVGLQDVGSKKVKNFSLGMKQRLGIAMALTGNPDLLLLDEPINGLDPQGIVEIREMLLKLNRESGITIIISSHILEELSKIATVYGFIDNGKLIKQISKDALLSSCRERIEIKLENPSLACPVLDGCGITNYKVVCGDTIEIYERLDDLPMINMELGKAGIFIRSISSGTQELESYFLELTGGKKSA